MYHSGVRVCVTGVGVVSPIGVGKAAFFDGVERGVRGQRVGDFGQKEKIAPASLRRMPRLSQLAIVAAKEALEEGAPPYDRARVGVVLGTGLGTLEETIAFMRGYVDGGAEQASPLLFPSSVMNAAAGQLAIECKLLGANSTVNHRDASALGALAMACDLLVLGRADAILCGAVDELSEPAQKGWETLGAREAGLVLGEGAGMLLLEREPDARARGARMRALVTGRGESADERPRIGWGNAPSWPGAARAVAEAAGNRAVDLVESGKNGTRYDAREEAAVVAGLGKKPDERAIVPFVGESLSSAAQRMVAAVLRLEHGARRVLVPSFAQGGANVAVVFEAT
jgi:3-oxoacyl-[acyl-carrier-protein] synthase II